MENPEHIAAQRRDPFLNPVVQTADDRRDGNNGSDTDDDAQNGQARSQFVRANGLQRHLDGFAGLLSSHGLLRESSRVISCQLSFFGYRPFVDDGDCIDPESAKIIVPTFCDSLDDDSI
jgi:hypothetical protein